jgi:hypothetical protein
VLPQALEDLNYTESESGWLGFGNSIAGIAGGVLVGPVTDIFFKVRLATFTSLVFISIIIIDCDCSVVLVCAL